MRFTYPHAIHRFAILGRILRPDLASEVDDVAAAGSCQAMDDFLALVISALRTCGLSSGFTRQVPEAGKYVVSVVIFIGRVGAMTLASALALRNRRRVIRLPEERPLIG